MADVFVSYVSDDRAFAAKIASGLEASGFSVWWDRHIHGGTEFAAEIERELDAAGTVVVLWSATSLNSQWVRDEAAEARSKNKLIPLRLDTVQPPLGFRQVQAIEFSGWDGDIRAAAFLRLVDSIRHALGVPVPASPQAATQAAPVAAADRPSIMVLPFQNLSDSQDTQYFASGVHEDLLSRLMRIPGIIVISRTTAVALANTNRSIREMAAEAGVAHVLEGSIRRSANRVRLTVQLIAAPAEGHVWAETYDRELADIFAVQDELAQSIAEHLRVRLDPKIAAGFARSGTRNIEAYDLWMRADEWHLNPADLERPIALLQQAIQLDPEFADAYTSLAMVGWPAGAYGQTWPEQRSRALQNLQKALSIDPENGRAIHAMSIASSFEVGTRAAGISYSKRALAAAPGYSYAHAWYGNIVPDYRVRLQHWQECHRLDPLNARGYVLGLLEQGSLEAALSAAQHMAAQAPKEPVAAMSLARAYFAAGDSISGLRQLRRAVQLVPRPTLWWCIYVETLWAVHQPAAAWRWLDALETMQLSSYFVGVTRAWGLLSCGTTTELGTFLSAWLARPGWGPGNARHAYYTAHMQARCADDAFQQGNSAARRVHLTKARDAFRELFARIPGGDACEVRTSRMFAYERFATVAPDLLLGLLRYATVARQLGDEARAERIAAHLNGILAAEVAPTGLPLERGMLAAFTGDITRALDEFTKALVPGTWCSPALEVYGVLDDCDGVFHGVAAEPVFQQLIADERSRRITLAQQIALEAPDLLDPGDLVLARAPGS